MTVYSVTEAAEHVRLKPCSIRELIRKGELPVVEAGRRTLILQSDLEDWVQSRRVVRKPTAAT